MKACPVRKPRRMEVFEIQCHACNQTVEICIDVVLDGWCKCPTRGCGQVLLIRWAEMRALTA